MIEQYIKAFSNLRTDKSKSRYPSFTNHRAPHKPFLLLSIMDLIAQGQITENFIEPSYDLVEAWNIYYSRIMPPRSPASMAYPFSRLKSDGFWQRLTKPGYDPEIEYNINSMNRLREVYYGAKMDDELFQYLCELETREQLRLVLIHTYFAPHIHPTLIEQGRVNLEAYRYSERLIMEAKEQSPDWNSPIDAEKARARDQGFRKAIVMLYNHRCALCGIRMITSEGHTIVEAAHIIPWNESYDDLPTNGMALCRLCHWSFDEGLMSVGTNYEVMVSRKIQTEQNLPGHILTLRDRNIFTPEDERFWPKQDNLNVHRRKYFKA
jgi:putative restriction endonuclease